MRVLASDRPRITPERRAPRHRVYLSAFSIHTIRYNERMEWGSHHTKRVKCSLSRRSYICLSNLELIIGWGHVGRHVGKREGGRGGVEGELTLNKIIMRIVRIERGIEAIRQLIVFITE